MAAGILIARVTDACCACSAGGARPSAVCRAIFKKSFAVFAPWNCGDDGVRLHSGRLAAAIASPCGLQRLLSGKSRHSVHFTSPFGWLGFKGHGRRSGPSRPMLFPSFTSSHAGSRFALQGQLKYIRSRCGQRLRVDPHCFFAVVPVLVTHIRLARGERTRRALHANDVPENWSFAAGGARGSVFVSCGRIPWPIGTTIPPARPVASR